ncbi:MAG: hypothetical protein SGCHY_004481, partial [Lobulomycetales sp.]
MAAGSCVNPPNLDGTRLTFHARGWNDSIEYDARLHANGIEPYFDPKKPTLIFIPGWAKEYTKRGFQFAFSFRLSYPHVPEFHGPAIEDDAWFDMWNVAMYSTTLYSDFPNPREFEAKIYSNKNMRWRDGENKVHTPCNTIPDITRLFLAKIRKLPFDPDLELRLVGQSTASNLALAAGSAIADQYREKLRIVLLDPIFFTFGKVRPNGKSVAETAYENGKKIVSNGNGVIEFYKCSGILQHFGSVFARSNNRLQEISAFVRLRPRYLMDYWATNTPLFTRLMLKHTVALDYYVRSLNFPHLALGAATPTEIVRQYSLSDIYLDQTNA